MATASEQLRYIDEGGGAPVLVLHGGMNEPAQWSKVAQRLVPRFRVLRLHRRQYRLDLAFDRPVTIAEEVADVLALTERIGRPVLVVGHSSGAVVALEAMAAAPERFAGAVLYEPPLVTGPPLGGDALVAAQQALAAGRAGKALGIFLCDIAGAPRWMGTLARGVVLVRPQLRPLIARQLDDAAAIDALGVRLAAYAEAGLATVFLHGDRSPKHLIERTVAAAESMPCVRKVAVLAGQGHNANTRAPDDVARRIADFADEVFAAEGEPGEEAPDET